MVAHRHREPGEPPPSAGCARPTSGIPTPAWSRSPIRC